MPSKRILVLAAGSLLVLGLGLVIYRWLPQEAPAPAAATIDDPLQGLETPLPPVFSAEDQGFVDCPEEMDEEPAQEPLEEIAAPSCMANLLPFGRPPAPIQAASSLAELRIACGAVFADHLFYQGEGRCQWGTAMFYGTDREIQIAWKNWKERKIPAVLRYVGPDLHFENGLRPGMLLKELTQLNGKAFTLSGFGWGESGLHRSFEGGALQAFDGPESPYLIQYALDWNQFDEASDAEHASIIVGDSLLDSATPALEKFQTHVGYIEFHMPELE